MSGDVHGIEPLLVVDVEHGDRIPVRRAVDTRGGIAAQGLVARRGIRRRSIPFLHLRLDRHGFPRLDGFNGLDLRRLGAPCKANHQRDHTD